VNESAHGPTAPWTDRFLLSVLFVSVIVTVAYVAIVSVGGRVFPSPLNSLVFVVLATTIISSVVLRARDQIIRHIDQSHARRAESAQTEVTRDLTRARVVASVPAVVGLDSRVVEMGNRISRRMSEGSEG
jgi:hypothetical protein